MQGSSFNRLQLIRDARGELVRRVWPRREIGDALGMAPDVEVAAQRLAAQHGLAPEVLEYDAENRAMLMPFVAGGCLEPDWFRRPERRDAMYVLLERLRRIPATALPPLDLAHRLRELHGRLAALDPDTALRRSIDVARVLALVEAARSEGPAAGGAAFQATESAVLVHGDLHPRNVIVRTDGSLCLLDWEYAHRGHGDEDLAGLATGVLPQHASPPTAELVRWSLQPSSFDLRRRLRALLDTVWLDLAATGGERGRSRANYASPDPRKRFMPTLKVVDRDGKEHDVPARSGVKVMETLRELDYGIAAICGGMCSCATCHIYIDPTWATKIPAPMSDERELLHELAHYKEGSRLSCQVDMTDELDGLRVTIAPDE